MVAVVLGLGLTAAPASASPALSGVVDQTSHEVRSYWTAQRMREAVPAEGLLAGVELPADAASLPRAGEPRSVAPAPRASAIGDAQAAPFRAHGKVYFTLDDGNPATGDDYVCSGTVVRARSKRLVTTAGHCVFGFDHFATNWEFVPAFRDGDKPFGEWTAQRLATTGRWSALEDISYDVGMATMRRNGNGKRIQEVVGARGIAFNQPRDQRYHAYGYPAEDPFSGNRLFMCDSAYEGADSGQGTPAPMRITCDMTGGSSGGGWIVGERFLNSVVSYGYECAVDDLLCEILGGNPEEGKLFGPYFGATIRKLYRTERRLRQH